MAGPDDPGSPPPEVPEEFSAAYRAAYEQALAAARDEMAATHARMPQVAQPPPRERRMSRRAQSTAWLVPLLLIVLAGLLVAGAYTLGRALAGSGDGGSGSKSPSPGPTTGTAAEANESATGHTPEAGSYQGKVTGVDGVRAKAGCTAEPGVDASGARVSYGAANLTDGAAETTWRCDGAAIGGTITLSLGKDVEVGAVGLIPGYAKTDEKSGGDRYAENNRVTEVRWTIGDREVIQRLGGSATDRSLRLVKVPRTGAESVELEILAVASGSRGTTAISEIQVARSD